MQEAITHGSAGNITLTFTDACNLEFPTVNRVCECVRSRDCDVEYKCFVMTNGTLVQGEIQDWLTKYNENFWAGLSYDGMPKMNDQFLATESWPSKRGRNGFQTYDT